MSIALLAQAAETAACCASKCPPHAAAALAGAVAIGFAAGWFAGRKGRKCGCAHKSEGKQQRHEDGGTRQAIPAGSVEIYVGNLSYDVNEGQLRKTFEKFGEVSTVRVVLNRFNNKSKGFGFVVMPNRAEAEKAINALNDREVLGRKMRVNEAKNTIKEDA